MLRPAGSYEPHPESLTGNAANKIRHFQQSSSCPGLSRASTSFGVGCKKDVDGRDKPGHDEK
jgi:hypothetical protein